MVMGGWVEIIRIKAVLSSTGLELELSLAKKVQKGGGGSAPKIKKWTFPSELIIVDHP